MYVTTVKAFSISLNSSFIIGNLERSHMFSTCNWTIRMRIEIKNIHQSTSFQFLSLTVLAKISLNYLSDILTRKRFWLFILRIKELCSVTLLSHWVEGESNYGNGKKKGKRKRKKSDSNPCVSNLTKCYRPQINRHKSHRSFEAYFPRGDVSFEERDQPQWDAGKTFSTSARRMNLVQRRWLDPLQFA